MDKKKNITVKELMSSFYDRDVENLTLSQIFTIRSLYEICNLKISRRILATSVVQLGGFLINKNIVYACSGNEPVTASYHDF